MSRNYVMGRNYRVLRIVAFGVCIAACTSLAAPAQEGKAANPVNAVRAQDAPKPDPNAKPQEAPQDSAKPPQAPVFQQTPVIQQGQPRRPPRNRQIVPSITEYRGGETLDVMSAKELVQLDLARVDFEADPMLICDDHPITRADLISRVCLLIGTNYIDQFITFHLANMIQSEMKAAGQAPPDLGVSEADLKKDLEAQEEMAPRMFGMDAALWKKQISEAMGWDRFVEMRKVQIGFEKLFLPDPPAGLKEAQKLKYEELKKAVPPAEPGKPQNPNDLPVPDADLSFIPAKTFELLDAAFGKLIKDTYARGDDLHPMLKMGVSMTIKKNLMSKVDVDFDPKERLRDGRQVLFTVEGLPVYSDEIFVLLKPQLTPPVWRTALRETLAMRAVDRALAEKGFLLSPEQANTEWQAMASEYDQNPLMPLPQVAMILGFSNVYHYKNYYVRKAGYRKLVRDTTPKEDVAKHYQKTGKLFFENGSLDGFVLFVPGEREEAEAKMKDAVAQLSAGKSFQELCSSIGQMPASGEVLAGGRVQPQYRNRLRMVLGESEYLSFVSGVSLADEAFYRAVEDGVVGPVYREQTPRLTGCMALQVNRFFSESALRPMEEYGVDKALDDLADLTFPRFVNAALGNLSIALPPAR